MPKEDAWDSQPEGNAVPTICRGVVLLSLLLASTGLSAAEADGDALTAKLAEMIRAAEKQAGGGDGSEALTTLEKAKALAAEAHRPEAAQIEARIVRLKEGLAQQQKVSEELKNVAVPADAEAAQPDAALPARPAIVLTQDECVEIALQNNLDLRVQRLLDRKTDFALDDAWAQYLPTIDASLTHSGTLSSGPDRNETALGFGVTQRSPWGTTVRVSGAEGESHPLSGGGARTSSWGVELTQPLWRGFGTDVGMFNIRSGRLGKLISRGSLELTVQTLVFNTRTAYSDCIRQIQNLEVNLRAVESAKVFLKLTQVREQAGQQTKLDVYNADVQLSDRQLAVITNQRALEQAYDTLKRIMDVDLEEQVAVESQPVDFGDQPPAGSEMNLVSDDAAGTVKLMTRRGGRDEGEPTLMFQAQRFEDGTVLSLAKANRIELLNAKRNVALQELNALWKKDGLGHQVDLDMSYERSGSGRDWSNSHGYEGDDYSVGLRYSIPWGKVTDKTAYERALLSIQESEIALKDVSNQVHQDVRNVLRVLREAEKSILIQGRKVEQAKRSVEAEKIRFERGLKDSFDVITAEDNLLSAKREFINRTIEYVVRLDELQLVIGAPTGRVDLTAKSQGGQLRTGPPVTLTPERTPKSSEQPDRAIKDRY